MKKKRKEKKDKVAEALGANVTKKVSRGDYWDILYNARRAYRGMRSKVYVPANGREVGLEIDGRFVKKWADHGARNKSHDAALRLWLYLLRYLSKETLRELKKILEEGIR